MNLEKAMPVHKAGELKCPICDVELPAQQTWPGARFRYCMSKTCKERLMKGQKQGWRYVEKDELACANGACDRFVPEGRYSAKPILTCSASCFFTASSADKTSALCASGCGTLIERIYESTGPNELVFCNQEHRSCYLRDEYPKWAGRFETILREYLHLFASHYYRDRSFLSGVVPFLAYLSECGIASPWQARPSDVSRYLAWLEESPFPSSKTKIGSIKTFYKWAAQLGLHTSVNPVINFLHACRRPKCPPRPFSQAEEKEIWSLLQARGTPQTRLATAIAREGGNRIGEIVRFKLGDVIASRQELFVGLPNKTMKEGRVRYSKLTKRYLAEWLELRDPKCGHDYLLHNRHKEPYTQNSLHEDLMRVLCTHLRGRQVNEFGLEEYSSHRMRHTMATALFEAGADVATVMTQGRWGSLSAMKQYTAISIETSQRDYERAMRLAEELEEKKTFEPTLSFADVISNFGGQHKDSAVTAAIGLGAEADE